MLKDDSSNVVQLISEAYGVSTECVVLGLQYSAVVFMFFYTLCIAVALFREISLIIHHSFTLSLSVVKLPTADEPINI